LGARGLGFCWGGSHAPVQFSLSSLQRRVLKNPDNLRVEKSKNGLPEVRKQKCRAAVGGVRRRDLEEELVRPYVAQSLLFRFRTSFGSCALIESNDAQK
jgi:hypothetical protein